MRLEIETRKRRSGKERNDVDRRDALETTKPRMEEETEDSPVSAISPTANMDPVPGSEASIWRVGLVLMKPEGRMAEGAKERSREELGVWPVERICVNTTRR